MYAIEKSLPLPPRKPAQYPLAEMAVGDSFLIPKGTKTSLSAQAKKLNIKVATRTVAEGTRVWRVA